MLGLRLIGPAWSIERGRDNHDAPTELAVSMLLSVRNATSREQTNRDLA
jgi:hypothetical protein